MMYPYTERNVDRFAESSISCSSLRTPDPYQWLEQDSEKLNKWIEEQNELTRRYTTSSPLYEEIKSKIEKVWNFPKYSSPYRVGEKYFFSKNDGLQNHSVMYMQDSLTSEPKVFLDVNLLSDDGSISKTMSSFSESGKFYAYGLSVKGSDWTTIYIRDVETGEDLKDKIENVKFSSISWTHDEKGFFYSKYTKEGEQCHSVFYHQIYTDQTMDILVYTDEKNPKFRHYTTMSDDGKYLLVNVKNNKNRGSKIFIADVKDPLSSLTFEKFIDNDNSQYSFICNNGTKFYFLTDEGAPRNHVVSIDKTSELLRSEAKVNKTSELLEKVNKTSELLEKKTDKTCSRDSFVTVIPELLRSEAKDLLKVKSLRTEPSAPELLRSEAKALLKGKSLCTTVMDLIPSGDTDLWKYSAPELSTSKDCSRINVPSLSEATLELSAPVISSVKNIQYKYFLVTYMQDVKDVVAVYSFDGRFLMNLPLPEFGSISISSRKKYSEFFCYCYGFLDPGTIYRCDLATLESKGKVDVSIFKQAEIPELLKKASKTSSDSVTPEILRWEAKVHEQNKSLEPLEKDSKMSSGPIRDVEHIRDEQHIKDEQQVKDEQHVTPVDDFMVEQVFYSSKDGTKISMFIMTRKDFKRDGNQPMYLYGYGGFNNAITPYFSILSIVRANNLGMGFAIANIRGGGEYGKEWHEVAMKLKKKNSFDDFEMAAEYLVTNKYTRPDKLCIHGASNGGLLVAACLNRRPDLYGCVIVENGVLDMLRFNKFTIGGAWCVEYGDPNDEEDFNNLSSYSPLHNISNYDSKGGNIKYPPVLVHTADHDDRVCPLHSYKYVSQLQYAQSHDNPMLIDIDKNTGALSSARKLLLTFVKVVRGISTRKLIEKVARRYVFMINALKLKFEL